jgi:hypothetical protein
MTFPSWRYGPQGEARVFGSASDVPEGWADHPSGPFAVAGGSKAQARPGELTDREINADLEAMGIEPDPTAHKSTRLKARNEARVNRK